MLPWDRHYVTWVSRCDACLPVTARLSGVNVASAAVTERGRRRLDWGPRHVVVMVEGGNDNIAVLAVVTLVVARSVMNQREGDKSDDDDDDDVVKRIHTVG